MRAAMVMPRCRPDDVRAVHKQAWSLAEQSIDVTLVTRQADSDRYMGMKVVPARAPFDNMFRALLNLPPLFLQCLRLDADIFVLRNPDTLLLGILLKLCRRRIVYDSHEDFTKRPMIHPTLPRPLRRPMSVAIVALERFLALISDGNIVTQRHQVAQFGAHKTIFVDNAPLVRGPIVDDSDAITNIARPDMVCLLYVGAISEDRGLFRMLDLVTQLNTVTPSVFRLVGRFRSKQLQSAAEAHDGWQFTEYYGHLPHAQALAHMRYADIGLAVLDPVADYPTSSITKLYEYMWNRLPFVVSNFDVWRRAVEPAKAGEFVDPTDSEELLNVVTHLAQNRARRRSMGESGRELVLSEINWDLRAREYCSLVNSVLEKDLHVDDTHAWALQRAAHDSKAKRDARRCR